MTQKKLEHYRKLAQKHGGKSGRIILELVQEVTRAGRFRLIGRDLRPLTEDDPWPYFGAGHDGKPLREVPDDYLCEWMMQRNRAALKVDADLALAAQLDLQLYDYVKQRIKRKSKSGEYIRTPEPEPQIEVPAPIPEAAVIEPEPEQDTLRI
jgi:hypothetical protein